MKTTTLFLISILCLALAMTAHASLIIKMQLLDGSGRVIGTVRADDTIYGLLLTPRLKGLKAGSYGFHIHECPLCSDNAKLVGGHLDLSDARQHRGPYEGNSHSGDLPLLIVDATGKATMPVLAPRLKLEQIVGRSLIIQAGGDTFSDTPVINGGGGAKIACGEIPYH